MSLSRSRSSSVLQRDRASSPGVRRLPNVKPFQLVLGAGILFAVITAISGVAPAVLEWHDKSEVTRETFGNVPSALKVTFYTVLPVVFIVLGWLVANRVKNYARGRPDDRRTTRANLHRRLRDFRRGVWMQTLLRDPAAGVMHSMIYFGFIVLFLVTVVLELNHQLPESLKFLHGDVYKAYSATGDQHAAVAEFQAAATAFERLGAVPEASRATARRSALSDTGGQIGADESQAHRTFMFTDIVGSTGLIEAIGDAAWARLLAWHDRTIRRLLGEHGGEEVHHAGDGVFAAFSDASHAISCAVAIQRTLAEHRAQHGFAPSVRIGLHSDVAQRTASGYEGRGVHIAARIGALAEADEILASRATFESSPRPDSSGAFRSVRLRGIDQPIEVAAIRGS